MDSRRFSRGSTISGIFDPNLKTPDPFQFIYISHPFGASHLTPSTPSDFYESSFEIMELTNSPPILSREGSTMNFHYNLMNGLPKCRPDIDPSFYNKPREYYDIKTTFYPSNLSNSTSSDHNQHHYPLNNPTTNCQHDSQSHNPKSYLQRHILSQEDYLGPKMPPPSQPTRKHHPSPYNCYDERTVPELKFIFETLRSVWKTPVALGKNAQENKCRKFCCQNLPHKRNGFTNSDASSGENITPTTRSNLMRRYSLPEIEIRKFGIVQEVSSILRFSEQLRRNFKPKLPPNQQNRFSKMKMVEKASQTNPVIITEKVEPPFPKYLTDAPKPHYNRQSILEFSDNGPSYLDLINNRRDVRPKLVKKPETMPEKCNDTLKLTNESYQLCQDYSENPFASNSELLKTDEKKLSIIKQSPMGSEEPNIISQKKDTMEISYKKKVYPYKKLKRENSDTYVSEILIKNLNEEIYIADILTKVLTEQEEEKLKAKPTTSLITPKIEISTVYVSPEKINEIVGKSTSIEIPEQVFKQTLQLPDVCLLDTFEKLPPLGETFNPTLTNNNTKNSNIEKENSTTSTTSNCKSNGELKNPNISEISSITFNDTFDTPTFPKTSDDSPIDSLDLDKPKLSGPSLNDKRSTSKSTTKKEFSRKPNNIAEIQPIKPLKEEKVLKQKSSSNQQPTSFQPEKQLVLPHRKRLNRPKVQDKDITEALEQYTIDSKGKPNYQKPSSTHKNQLKNRYGNQSSAINSRYLRVSASSTTSRHSTNQNDKLKKVTIFEAQSNMVTPDNDMGPKRFYQKTEIFDGDKKIDILEIVECLQSPFTGEPKTPGDFYTKFSKIPIPIRKCCRSFQNQPSFPSFNSCSAHFKCCSSSIMKPQLMGDNTNFLKSIKSFEESERDVFRNYMLHESLDKCEHFDLKTSNNVTTFCDKDKDVTTGKRKHDNSHKSNLVNDFKESGDLNMIDNSIKSSNINDGISTTNDAYTISVPSTMTAHHGSTPRRKSSSKNKFHPQMKSTSKTSQVSGLLHSRSKKIKNSARTEKRLLSQRKQHRNHDIINVKPAKCNQSVDSSRYRKMSSRPTLTFNDDKLNAWRIPSSDFYMPPKHPPIITDNKRAIINDDNLQAKPAADTVKFHETRTDSNVKDKCTPSSKCPTESIISMTTICEKCRLCSCYTSTTFSDRLLYSPTLSVCSVCSQPFTPIYRTPETPAGVGCFDINCSHNTILKSSFNDEFGNKNKTSCFPPASSSQRNEMVCSRGKDCNCSNNRFPKLISNECPPIPEKYCGFIQTNTSNICKANEQQLDRFLTSSSSFTSSLWKSARSHTAMPCINWKAVFDNKKKPEIKIEPVKLTTTMSDDKKGNNSIFTVTVKGPTLEKGTDLKMELCFSNPTLETTANELDNETDDVSTCSVETIHERMLPEGSKDCLKVRAATETTGRGTDHLDSDYHLNLSSILNQKNTLNINPSSPSKNKNLSVSGNAIAPEQKPKAPTMTEKDLTGRYRK